MSLHRYWFEFDTAFSDPHPIGTLLGCGITAYSQSDALLLLQERVFGGNSPPPVKRVVENVDVSQLDQAHIRPNMGNPAERGIWYPLGYNG